MPLVMRNSMLLRLALGSRLSMVSRTMSSKSNGTSHVEVAGFHFRDDVEVLKQS